MEKKFDPSRRKFIRDSTRSLVGTLGVLGVISGGLVTVDKCAKENKERSKDPKYIRNLIKRKEEEIKKLKEKLEGGRNRKDEEELLDYDFKLEQKIKRLEHEEHGEEWDNKDKKQ